MKIVFCDFDGVINTFDPNNMAKGDHFSVEACDNLNKLLNLVPDLNIVVSSSWRMWGLEQMKLILYKNGIDPHRVIDITGDEHGTRGYQIQCWLDRNSYVTNFVILDDEVDIDNLINKLVETNSVSGLTENDVQKALDILLK